MTPAAFRKLALAFSEAVEGAHGGHPDFRVAGRVFASLGYPDKSSGTVALTPDQQHAFVSDHPDAFYPAAGAWGERGYTIVRLAAVSEDVLGEALTLAWQNTVNKGTPKRKRR